MDFGVEEALIIGIAIGDEYDDCNRGSFKQEYRRELGRIQRKKAQKKARKADRKARRKRG